MKKYEKYDLLRSGESIIRVLDVQQERVLVIDCINRRMPVWVKISGVEFYSECSDCKLSEITGVDIVDVDTLDAEHRRIIMYEKIPLMGVDNIGWLRLRKSGIGGSDAGSICGVNPYSSAMKVFQDKTSEEIEEQDNEAIRIGHDLEDYVAQRFTEATGLKVRKSNFMYRSKEYPFMIADVDRLVVGEDAGLECKTASAYNADKWADGNIPLHYVMQCLHYMAVTGKKTWYIAAVILGREFTY